MVSPRAAAAYIDSQPISEGVLLVKIRLRSSALCVICAAAPTNDHADEQKDAFFDELQHATDSVAARNTLVLGGNCNAQVGTGKPSALAWLPWEVCLEEEYHAHL